MTDHAAADADRLRAAYIELLKRALTGAVHQQAFTNVRDPSELLGTDVVRLLDKQQLRLVKHVGLQERRDLVTEGRGGWPVVAETMIGLRRLENVQRCVEDVLAEAVPGDLIEAGVWRGGATIFMRGLLEAHGVYDRRVWAADSFAGLPVPDPERYPADEGDRHHRRAELAVPLDVVKENFRRYGLLDDQVCFLEGWFRDTLPPLKESRWALIRIDGDMYESTMDGLRHLYPQLAEGGYLIVDDYWAIPACRQAVDRYRSDARIEEPLVSIDWTAVYWRREP